MPIDPRKTKRIAVQLPVELAAKVTALADADRRSMSSWVRNAIEDAASDLAPLGDVLMDIPTWNGTTTANEP